MVGDEMMQQPGVPGVRQGRFRPDIQGLRAVAVLLVVAYHAGVVFPGGYIGVDVFFVLSGYVIARTLLDELAETGRVSFSRFYLRRIKRLLPALAVVLIVVLLGGILLTGAGVQPVLARTGIGASLLNANTYLASQAASGDYFAPRSEANPLLHTWSLSVEEQFYLVFPAAVAGAWALGRRTGRSSVALVAVVLGIGAAVSAGLAWALTARAIDPGGFGPTIAFYTAPARAWEFAAGAMVALAAPQLASFGRRLGATAAIGGAVAVVGSALLFTAATPFPGLAAWIPVLGTVGLVAAGDTRLASVTDAWLGWQPLRYLGDLSYGWYLWHWPLIVFATALWPTTSWVPVVAAIVSLGPTMASYQLVENPIRFSPTLTPVRVVAVGLVGVAVPVVAGVALIAANDRIRSSDALDAFADEPDRGCFVDARSPDAAGTRCRFDTAESAGTAVLIGDSNAWHVTEAFVAGAHGADLDAEVATVGRCPFVDLVIIERGEDHSACAAANAIQRERLVDEPPTIVVLSSAVDLYLDDPEVTFRSPDGEIHAGVAAKEAAFEAALVRTLDELQASGTRVISVAPVPRLREGWTPNSEPSGRVLRGDTESVGVARAEAQARQATALAVLERASAGRAVVLDPFDTICPTSPCEPFDDDELVFIDWSHLSATGSRRLTAPLAAAFDQALAA
ncbi:MAG: acyltransferase family protein [Actinomycetota bacterium]